MEQRKLVSLKRLVKADAEKLARLANNKRIWDNVRDNLPHPYSRKDANDFINHTRKEKPPVTFGIFYQDEFCGMIGLVPQPDIYRLSAEVGYWIGEPYWNKGVATDAVRLITHYGFEELKLERIYAGVFEYNKASMRVLEKNGYEKEGVSRNALVKNNRVFNEHRYGITKSGIESR